MVTRLIPIMSNFHHGGYLPVMIMVGICQWQLTISHHWWWLRNQCKQFKKCTQWKKCKQCKQWKQCKQFKQCKQRKQCKQFKQFIGRCYLQFLVPKSYRQRYLKHVVLAWNVSDKWNCLTLGASCDPAPSPPPPTLLRNELLRSWTKLKLNYE